MPTVPQFTLIKSKELEREKRLIREILEREELCKILGFFRRRKLQKYYNSIRTELIRRNW